MGGLLKELKRRNVFRVGVAYVIVSWLIIQVIETVSDPLGLPDWTEAFFIVFVLAGLPLVLLFAWAFELTPEGLKKTKEVDTDMSVTADTGKKLNYTIIAVLVIALAYSVWERQGLVEQSQTDTVAGSDSHVEEGAAHSASIAVLPFVNMSADPDQEYFSDGISEELLNLLAKIPELRVPARTSSFQFKGQNLDIADVAEQLNVDHVLEGSVRRADVRIRVTAQLIEADTGYHLWSETYDRELTDIFEIQDEISIAIVESLSETLGIKASAAPQVTAAANPEAYNAYLLGQHLIKQRTKGEIEAAALNFEKSIELDSNYAPAHAGLGLAWRLLLDSRMSYGTLTLDEMLSKAMPHLERALELNSDLPEALGAMGLTREAQEKYEEAIEYYEKALAINPSQTDIRNWYSNALQMLGRDDDSRAEIEKAYELDPLSLLTLNNYTNELVSRRQFDRVGPVIARLSQLDPARGATFQAIILSEQHKAAEGTVIMFRGLDMDPGNLRARAIAAFDLVRLDMIDAALQIWPYPNILPIVSSGDDTEHALELAKEQLENDPTDPGNIDALAWAYWGVGNKEQALKNASRYLKTLGDTRQKIDFTNWIFIMDAWERGDQEIVFKYLEPLEANIDQAMASGSDNSFQHYAKAIMVFMRGDTERSLEYLDTAFSRRVINSSNINDVFELLGWDDMPEYAKRKKQHQDYVRQERHSFLAVACGPDGFSAWQPSPETCAEIDET